MAVTNTSSPEPSTFRNCMYLLTAFFTTLGLGAGVAMVLRSLRKEYDEAIWRGLFGIGCLLLALICLVAIFISLYADAHSQPRD